ncbi:MAG: DNA (cytosine-5-)-methyltransferase [Deltaproteobacteria bacterium HGW-Deltaproteobacteria-15]|jgi:DNA (cytosine-5)-methyltransferase 1|nr:MAG: DNA (cytosine-5-)-methyltransferase [Deltaproteobacteria bacterium HGW-Deltaproteobacteria-15]
MEPSKKSRKSEETGTGISCVDIFCGAGGLTYGFAKEGISVVAGFDLDPACEYPYSRNNGAKFIKKDICKMLPSEIEELFIPGTVRLLAGCAPCQPFSTYSQRYDTEADGKWKLLTEFERLALGVRPDILTMENVPTIVKHRVFESFVKSLTDADYQVWSDVVECAAYGVPQTRKRMVLIASLHGQIELISPTRTSGKYKTVGKVIGSLPALKAGESSRKDRLHVASSLSETNLKRIRASKPGGTWRDWPDRLVAECHRNDSGKTYPSVYGRMEWDKPAPTMTTQCYGFGNGRFGHPDQDRGISLREAALLQGFPRSYRFVPPRGKIYFKTLGRLIGNAVPVHLGRAIAKSILVHIKELGIDLSSGNKGLQEGKVRPMVTNQDPTARGKKGEVIYQTAVKR